MTKKKFTLAAVAAAAIAAAPLVAPVFGAGSQVFAADDDWNHAVSASVIAAYAGATDPTSVAKALANAAGKAVPTGGTTVSARTTDSDTATIPVSGTVTTRYACLLYKDASGKNEDVDSAAAGATFKVVQQVTLGDGTTYYKTSSNEYLDADDVNSSKVVTASSTSTKVVKKSDPTTKLLGAIRVKYNGKYGIQIWNKAGQIVRYNATDANAWNKTHSKKVKVGDAKKLPGQTTWKVFNATYTDHGTTYYNLGGDQYIDAHYAQKIK